MKKTEWDEASAARRNAGDVAKDRAERTAGQKAVEKKAARKGQANFSAEVLEYTVQGIINNQVP